MLLCLKGLESVGGFAGRRVGVGVEVILVKLVRGAMPPVTDAVLSIPDEFFLPDLRPKMLESGILRLFVDVLWGVLLQRESGDHEEGS